MFYSHDTWVFIDKRCTYCTSGNASSLLVSVHRQLLGLIPRQLQASQRISDGFLPVLPWSSSYPFPSRIPGHNLFDSSILFHTYEKHTPSTSIFSDDVFYIYLPFLSLIVLFVILSRHDTRRILFSHLWYAAFSLFLFATVIGHISDPYSSVLKIMELYGRK